MRSRYPPRLDKVSGQAARHNGTSWHLDDATWPSFVPDVRECHPLLQPPFGIGRRLSGRVKGQRGWRSIRLDDHLSRPPLTRRPTLECENLFQNIPWGGRFLSSESTTRDLHRRSEYFPSFCSSTSATLPSNFAGKSKSLLCRTYRRTVRILSLVCAQNAHCPRDNECKNGDTVWLNFSC